LELLSGCGVPEAYDSVVASCGQHPAIWRKGNYSGPLMSWKHVSWFPGRQIPDEDSSILKACRGQRLAVRRKRNVENLANAWRRPLGLFVKLVLMAVKLFERVTGSGITEA